MTKDQKELVEKVMKELVSPYRKEDGDEVMEIVKANGGMEKINLAFYQEGEDDRDGTVGVLAAGRPGLRLELPRPAAHPHVREHQLKLA